MVLFIDEFWCAVIAGLKEKFDEATRRNDVKAIVLTGNIYIYIYRVRLGSASKIK